MSRINARVRSINQLTADGLLALLLILILAAETAAYADGDMGRVLTAMGLAIALCVLTVRRTRPIPALVSITIATTLLGAIEPAFFQTMAAPFLASMVALYSVARHVDGPRAMWICAAFLALSAFSVFLSGDIERPVQYLWLLVLGGAPVVVGRTLRNRRRLQDELRARTQELEREGELRSNRAVDDERVRIAGELQAVVANGVSAMVVQAEAVPRAIAAGEPSRADESLFLIEETGRESLAEMRRLLGVLRHDEDARALAPQPTLAQAQGLIERAAELELEVALDIQGKLIPLPAGIDLAAYRVLEETLTSAARDGAGNASVVVSYREGELRLEISDDRTAAEPEAEPLRRIRERLGLYGGRVQSSRADGGTQQRLVARLPLGGSSI